MAYDVVLYCPDRHIVYDGETPRRRGVGGGITARVRMAEALARAGHRVTAAVNCGRPSEVRGVRYLPLDEVDSLSGDVVLLMTSGDRLDLSPALKLRIEDRLRIVWVHGPAQPIGLEALQPDVVYAVSNFIAGIVKDEWGVPAERAFVTYNGYDEDLFRQAELDARPRDPFQLVYFSHPSKGLDTALAVLGLLRSVDRRFQLKVFGSEALWGETSSKRPAEDGVTWGGLIGQEELSAELIESAWSLHLQDRDEPFGLALVEAMRAGCIAVASGVGAHLELIQGGENGVLISGDHRDASARSLVASQIVVLAKSAELRRRMSRAATGVPWSTDRMAEAWTGHWDWWLSGRPANAITPDSCRVCGGPTLSLPDGEHCLACAAYRAVVPQPA